MSIVKNFGLFICWLIIILYLSFSPLKNWPQQTIFQKLYFDKVVHITMYAVLSFLLLRSIFFYQKKQPPRFSIVVVTFICCAGMGIAIEFLQPLLTAFRKFEWLDMVANAAGAITGILLFRRLFLNRKTKLRPDW